MDVNGKVKALTESSNELGSSCGTQQTCHVLDCQDMCTSCHNLICESEVVVQGVLVLGRIQQVTGVANSYFSNSGAGFQHSFDSGTHLVDIVERIKYSEDVNAGCGSFLNECLGDFFWVWGVAHSVTTTQQHLDGDVGQCFTQLGKTVPGVFSEEAQCNVVRCSTPCFNREELRSHACYIRSHIDEVLGANARSKK